MTAAPASPPAAAATLDADGWIHAAHVRRVPSPNADARPPGEAISLLVLHNISLPPDDFGGPHIEGLFTNTLDIEADPWFERLRALRVSAHFVVDRTGAITQYVATRQRAWHAGVSHFAGRERCNDFSIGIELEGCDTQPFEDAQYGALAWLVPLLRRHHPLRDVRGHEHIAPGRKTDPGPCFDWVRFGHACGWPDSALPPPGHGYI